MHRWRSRAALLLCGLVLATLMPAVSTPAVAAAATVPKIMVVGDSLSQGLEGDYTWRYRLSQSLARSGKAVDFVGPWTGTNALSKPAHSGAYRPGVTFDNNNLAKWGWQLNQAKDAIGAQVATYQPTHLLVELGFNDLAFGVNTPAGVLNDLEWFIYHARANNPYVNILVANVPQRSALSNVPNLPTITSDYNSRLAARIPALTNAISRVTLVDIATPYKHATD